MILCSAHYRALLLPVAITVVMTLQVSCGGSKTLVMYDGERLPADRIAVIDISDRSLFVMGIDSLVNRYRALSEDRIEVTPGEHTLVLNYTSWKGRSEEPMSLTFTALAGHSYQVLVSAGYRKWTAWIVDLRDGSIVAGSKP